MMMQQFPKLSQVLTIQLLYPNFHLAAAAPHIQENNQKV
jgi:hypothetical protein